MFQPNAMVMCGYDVWCLWLRWNKHITVQDNVPGMNNIIKLEFFLIGIEANFMHLPYKLRNACVRMQLFLI